MAKLVLAMENDGAIGGAGDADLVDAANTATEVEAGAAESAEVEHSVSDIDTGISDAGEAADGLAEVQGEVADAVASGDGLSEREARLAEMAVEGYCKMVGINARKERLFPSMENFGGRHSKLAATRIVLENVGETLKRIWEAIKAAVARVIEWIKSFFNGMLKNVDQLAKHIANLEKRVDEISSSAKPKNSSFSTGAKTFCIDGTAKFDHLKTIVKNSVGFLSAVGGINDGVKKLMHDAFYSDAAGGDATYTNKNGVSGTVMGIDEDGHGITHKYLNNFVEDTSKKLSAAGDNPKLKDLKAADKEKLIAFGPLPDGMVICIRKSEGDDKQKVTVKLERNESPSANSIEAPSKAQMQSALKDVKGPLDELKKFDRTSKSAQKTLEEMMAHANKMSKMVGDAAAAQKTDKTESDSAREGVEKKNKEFTDQINTMKSISVDAPAMAFKAIKGVADYVAAGVSNMKVDSK